jgi:sensor histidine kinase YesM
MNFRLLFSFIFLPFLALAQQKEIDSLFRILPSVHDSARVDCLNELSFQYTRTLKRDSAVYFQSTANAEARNLGYIHGIAVAISNQAFIAEYFDNDFNKSESLSRESVRWFGKTANQTRLDRAYKHLWFALFSESKYDEAYTINGIQYEKSKQNQDEQGMYDALGDMSTIHFQKGNYDSSFNLLQQSHHLAKNAGNDPQAYADLIAMGTLYRKMGDYPNALKLYRQVFENDNPKNRQFRIDGDFDIWSRMEYAELFSLQGQYDSAWHYYHLFDTTHIATKDLRIYLVSTGETYLLQKNYDKALKNFLPGLAMHRELNDQNEIKRTLLDIANAYIGLNKNEAALKYAYEALALSLETNSNQFIRDSYEILYTVYDRLHKTDSAYAYYQKYITLKDIVVNEQIKGKFAAYDYQQKIETLNNEKLISQQQLNFQRKQLTAESRLRNILILCILGALVLGVIVFRNITLNRKNEKLRSESAHSDLQRKTVDLEMQALRAQMSPHFIFNCLNSINRFILKNETEAASDYLTKFSRLIRMVLVNSKNKMISLDDELNMLKLYLDMERLRFKNSFDYNISFINSIDADNIFLPPLLMQPFAENAIWHGLMNKNNGSGHLEISFNLENDHLLLCTITDNGVGREAAAAFKSKSAEKQKSMGLQITRERLDLMNGNGEGQTSFEVEDLVDSTGLACGTKVVLKIRLKEHSESYA